ncbi:ATPase subunit of ABC transporter with duplicated ATPase domains [Scopulibacillus darangshiensis]|uniref:ATPase subunit of ABC transporter with duplicated ATPase domains n=1 Tax=Scopulibacillus darangshiensis TaxID=442528 RepID=A0A4R2P4V8_9BACL|nr:ABC-F family ATP-binding cassette domain-containing protein [Scopulibacillus darangshiensis]TCP29802.1 ATPase subunit of ABC transporter with duplicated ATPase domains [Scopulibacillus darangshiensis]
MMICQVERAHKNIGGQQILKEVSLSLNEGEKAAVVGVNGSGKTTLFNLIAGYENPDQGAVHIKKEATVGYLRQMPVIKKVVTVIDVLKATFEQCVVIEKDMRDIEKQLTAADPAKMEKLLKRYGHLQEKFQESGGYEMDARIQATASGLKITTLLDKTFDQLSGGERTKVWLAVQLLKGPDLLLLDEPTNHLDIIALEWLEQFIRHYEGTVLVISHDRQFLDQTVTKIFDLEDGELTAYPYSYSAYVNEKEERLLRAFAAYEDQQRKIKKMQETIKRLKEWANRASPPNAGMHRQAKSMEKALDRIVKLKRPKMDADLMGLSFKGQKRSGDDVIYSENMSMAFGRSQILTDIQFHLRNSEKVAIVGANGSGKSTFLKCLMGELVPSSGIVERGSQATFGILAQDAFHNESSMTVIEAFRENLSIVEGQARHILAKFLFYGPDVFKPLKSLSGGERVRLKLAQLMHQGINVLILDEPTNHLDIESREVLEEAIDGFNGTVLAVSHDRFFLNQCFKTTYWLEGGSLYRYEGEYDYAREKHAAVMNKSGNPKSN